MSVGFAAACMIQLDRARLKDTPGFMFTLTNIARGEGLRGLFRGALARVAFTAPNIAITMVVYDRTLHFLK